MNSNNLLIKHYSSNSSGFERKQNSNNLFSFLNKILYKIDSVNDIDELEPFMYCTVPICRLEIDKIPVSNYIPVSNIVNNNSGSLIEQFKKTEVKETTIVDIVDIVDIPVYVPVDVPKINKLHKKLFQIQNKNIHNKENKENKENIQNVHNNIIYPKNQNSLFWCIYIAINGYDEYLMIGKNFSNKQLEERHRIMNSIKGKPNCMKELNTKITNILVEQILSELLVENNTNLFVLNAFVIYYNVNIYIINKHNKTYLKFMKKHDNQDENTKTIVLQINREHKYGLLLDYNISNIDDEFLFLENHEKPFKGISTYKVIELENIYNKCKRLNQDTIGENIIDNIKMKKNDIYQRLTELCVWKI